MNKNDSQNSKVQKATGRMLPPNAGKGRVKGVPNKSTQKVREMMAMIAEENAENFIAWLAETAAGNPEAGLKPDPKGAADLYLKAIEYHIPKLARTEVTGDGGGPLSIKVVSGIDE